MSSGGGPKPQKISVQTVYDPQAGSYQKIAVFDVNVRGKRLTCLKVLPNNSDNANARYAEKIKGGGGLFCF